MRIKNHPPVFFDIYVDGRISTLAPEPPVKRLDKLKIAMIEGWFKAQQKELVKQLKPGRYRIKMSRCRVFQRNIDFDLFEV